MSFRLTALVCGLITFASGCCLPPGPMCCSPNPYAGCAPISPYGRFPGPVAPQTCLPQPTLTSLPPAQLQPVCHTPQRRWPITTAYTSHNDDRVVNEINSRCTCRKCRSKSKSCSVQNCSADSCDSCQLCNNCSSCGSTGCGEGCNSCTTVLKSTPVIDEDADSEDEPPAVPVPPPPPPPPPSPDEVPEVPSSAAIRKQESESNSVRAVSHTLVLPAVESEVEESQEIATIPSTVVSRKRIQ